MHQIAIVNALAKQLLNSNPRLEEGNSKDWYESGCPWLGYNKIKYTEYNIITSSTYFENLSRDMFSLINKYTIYFYCLLLPIWRGRIEQNRNQEKKKKIVVRDVLDYNWHMICLFDNCIF